MRSTACARPTAWANVQRGTVHDRGFLFNTESRSEGPQDRHFFVSWSLVKTFPLLLTLIVAGGFQAPGTGHDPLLQRSKGKASAPVTVYEMADFQCPACRMFTVTVLPALDSEFIRTGKVRWVFINLPLTSIHANAMLAAEVAMCAGRQGRFWQTHDAFYQHQDDWAKLAAGPARAALVALHETAFDIEGRGRMYSGPLGPLGILLDRATDRGMPSGP